MSEWTDDQLREAERHLEGSIIESYGPAYKRAPASNNASLCGHPCAYYLWALRARNEDIPTPDDGLPGVWALGREAENAAKVALLKEGWNLHRTECTFEDKDMDLRGKLDWELSRDTHPVWCRPMPTEFKGASANYMGTLYTFEDCFNARMKWVRLWPMQALSYAYLMPEEHPLVCLLMRNKTNAKPRAIIERTEQHFDKLQAMGEVLAEVNGCLRGGGEPSAISYNPVWCKDCDARHICPTMQHHHSGAAMRVLDNPVDLDELGTTWWAGQATKKSVGKAWDDIKAHCEHYGLYKGEAGEERTVVGTAFTYTVKCKGGGKGTLSVKPLAQLDDAEG